MSTTYAQRQTTAQKKDANTAASVLDASSQSESLQRKADMANNAAQRAEAPRPNNTGMPDNLKSGIESLSGFSMDDVRVHYNSSKPATVQALAYTQGTDIHVAPGQEKHLPHEAWHVAQQMAGRVSPTTNINGMPVNDNAALEHEADVMGEKASSIGKTLIVGNDIVQNAANTSAETVKDFLTPNNGLQRKADMVGTHHKGNVTDSRRPIQMFRMWASQGNPENVKSKSQCNIVNDLLRFMYRHENYIIVFPDFIDADNRNRIGNELIIEACENANKRTNIAECASYVRLIELLRSNPVRAIVQDGDVESFSRRRGDCFFPDTGEPHFHKFRGGCVFTDLRHKHRYVINKNVLNSKVVAEVRTVIQEYHNENLINDARFNQLISCLNSL